MADLKVIALSCALEALGSDSENLLWSEIRTDYFAWSQDLICHTRFNCRGRTLQPYIQRLQEKVADNLQHGKEVLVVDYIPVPVVKMAREKTHKAFKRNFETAPAKVYCRE